MTKAGGSYSEEKCNGCSDLKRFRLSKKVNSAYTVFAQLSSGVSPQAGRRTPRRPAVVFLAPCFPGSAFWGRLSEVALVGASGPGGRQGAVGRGPVTDKRLRGGALALQRRLARRTQQHKA